MHAPVLNDKILNRLKKGEPLLKADSRVVQLDFTDDNLLVSSLTRCVIYNLKSHSVVPVGKKTRQGHYGACFSPDGETLFSARPGMRLWSCGLSGAVAATLNFQEALQEKSGATTVQDALSAAQHAQWQEILDEQQQGETPTDSAACSFSKVIAMSDRFYVSWYDTCLFVIDAIDVEIPVWCASLLNVLLS